MSESSHVQQLPDEMLCSRTCSAAWLRAASPRPAASARPGALPSTPTRCCARSSCRSRWAASSSNSTCCCSRSFSPPPPSPVTSATRRRPEPVPSTTATACCCAPASRYVEAFCADAYLVARVRPGRLPALRGAPAALRPCADGGRIGVAAALVRDARLLVEDGALGGEVLR